MICNSYVSKSITISLIVFINYFMYYNIVMIGVSLFGVFSTQVTIFVSYNLMI